MMMIFFSPEDGDSMFLRNVIFYRPVYTAPRTQKNIIIIIRIEFVDDRMSYLILRGRWCDDIVLNVHAPTEDKCDDTRDSFYETVIRFHRKSYPLEWTCR
jgi:hypothetical protein